jgi:hypothetical protein
MGSPLSIVTYGLGGVAVFGIVSIILQKLASGSKVADAIQLFKHKESQDQAIEKVKTFTKEQEVVNKQLHAAEAASDESKKRVQQIVQKAAVDVQQVLKADSIQKVDDQIDDDWGKL